MLASCQDHVMLIFVIKFQGDDMSTKKFDATPTASESLSLDEISTESMQQAWKAYESKPEYKDFNKHDLIESLQTKPQQLK